MKWKLTCCKAYVDLIEVMNDGVEDKWRSSVRDGGGVQKNKRGRSRNKARENKTVR